MDKKSAIKLCKFGGTSVADAKQIKRVKQIIERDERPKCYVVVSAPAGITDKLHTLYEAMDSGFDINTTLIIYTSIIQHFNEIVTSLGLDFYKPNSPLLHLTQEMEQSIRNRTAYYDFIVSFGERMNACIIAEYLGFTHVDAFDLIKFTDEGYIDFHWTNLAVDKHLTGVKKAVIPGYYGGLPQCGSEKIIKVFSRGGSDTTAVLLARSLNVPICEFWKDVPGLLVAPPHIISDAPVIPVVRRSEVRELAYSGAKVIHEDAVCYLCNTDIVIHVRNTMNMEDHGTYIVPDDAKLEHPPHYITGIASKHGFHIINIRKKFMNLEIGFARKVLSVLENYAIPYQHMPDSIDSLSLLIQATFLGKHRLLDSMVSDIQSKCKPDSIQKDKTIALICIVGWGMAHTPGIAARIFAALGRDNINVRVICQGASEISIILGVEEKDLDQAVRVIYDEFMNKK